MPEKEKKGPFHINYEILRYKLHYFLFCGAAGGFLPFIPIFTKTKLSLSSDSLATLFTMQRFILMITKSMSGVVVDYFNKLKLIMLILCVGQLVFYTSLLGVPRVQNGCSAVQATIEIPNTSQLPNDHLNRSLAFVSVMNNRTEIHDYSIENNETILLLENNKTKFSAQDILSHDNFYNSTSIDSTSENFILDLSRGSYADSCCDDQDSKFGFFWKMVEPSTQLQQVSSICDCSKSRNNRFNCVLLISSNMSRNQVQNEGILIDEHTCNMHKNSIMAKSYTNITFLEENGNCNYRNSDYASYQYWLFTLILVIGGMCSNCLFSLADTACYETIQKTGSDFGKQRLWGAISWGLISPLAGFLNDFATGNSPTPTYAPGFGIFIILSIGLIWNLSKLDLVKPDSSGSIFKDIKKIFSSSEFIAVEIAVFINGFFASSIWFYLLVYLEGIGSNRLVMGLVQTSQCFLGEIPLMYFSGPIIQKLGCMNVLTLALLAYSLRFICYYFLWNPWFVIPIESLHGLTYGVFYAAMTSYAKTSSCPGTEATTQSVLCSTFEGLGSGFGCIVTGIGFQSIGGRNMFFWLSLASLFTAFYNTVTTILLKITASRRAQVEEDIKP